MIQMEGTLREKFQANYWLTIYQDVRELLLVYEPSIATHQHIYEFLQFPDCRGPFKFAITHRVYLLSIIKQLIGDGIVCAPYVVIEQVAFITLIKNAIRSLTNNTISDDDLKSEFSGPINNIFDKAVEISQSNKAIFYDEMSKLSIIEKEEKESLLTDEITILQEFARRAEANRHNLADLNNDMIAVNGGMALYLRDILQSNIIDFIDRYFKEAVLAQLCDRTDVFPDHFVGGKEVKTIHGHNIGDDLIIREGSKILGIDDGKTGYYEGNVFGVNKYIRKKW